MINHLRTLLLQGTSLGEQFLPGEEYVPEGFHPQPLSAPWDLFWDIVCGGGDRVYINWRLTEYLQILHAGPLDTQVRIFDPRITYLPLDNQLVSLASQGPQIVGPPGLQIVSAPPATNVLWYSWSITPVGAILETTGELAPGPGSPAQGWSVPWTLPGLPVQVQIAAGAQGPWQVTWLVPPARTLQDVWQDVQDFLDQGMVTTFFAPNGPWPWSTWQALWQRPEFPWRLAAALFAWVAQQTNLLVS
jgi:hypothetical protein